MASGNKNNNSNKGSGQNNSNNNGNNSNSGLPAWLTAGNGGTAAPIPVSAWLSPDYPGGYAGWLNDHPNPGNSPTPPDNQVYATWLKQQVGPDGQLHLPPASAVPGNGGTTAPSPAPAPIEGTGIAAPNPGNVDGGTEAPNAGAVPHETIPMPGPATIPNDSIGGNGGQGNNNGNGGTTAPAKTHGQANNGGISAPADVTDAAAGNGGVTAQTGNGNKLTASQRRGFRSGGSRQEGDGAIAAAGDGFPTTSSYPTSDGALGEQQVADASRSRKDGWGGGMEDTSKDPAQIATYLNSQQNTDPLSIKDDTSKA